MKLTYRDQAKVNAALVLLHDRGHDTGEVTRLAQTGINSGTPIKLAYERAFNAFAARNPSMQAPLQRLGQLVDASNDQTVARYNVSLRDYIATGDRARFEADVAPVAQQDMATMARLTGDAGFADGLPDAPTSASGSPQGHPATPDAAAPQREARKPYDGPRGRQLVDAPTRGPGATGPQPSGRPE